MMDYLEQYNFLWCNNKNSADRCYNEEIEVFMQTSGSQQDKDKTDLDKIIIVRRPFTYIYPSSSSHIEFIILNSILFLKKKDFTTVIKHLCMFITFIYDYFF